MRCDEVHERLEGQLFLRSGVGPEWFENRLPVFKEVEPKKVLEDSFFQRVALHVEEKVAIRCLGKPVEALAFDDRKNLEDRFA